MKTFARQMYRTPQIQKLQSYILNVEAHNYFLAAILLPHVASVLFDLSRHIHGSTRSSATDLLTWVSASSGSTNLFSCAHH